MKLIGARNTLRRRLSVNVAASVLLVSSLVVSSMLAGYRHDQDEALRRHAMWVAGNVALLYSEGLAAGDMSAVYKIVESLAGNDRAGKAEQGEGPLSYIDVLDKSGWPMAVVNQGLGDGAEYDMAGYVIADLEETAPTVRTVKLTGGGNVLVAVYPVYDDGRRIGTVRAGVSDSLMRVAGRRTLMLAAVLILAACFLALLLGGRIAGLTLVHIKALADGAGRISGGDLDQRVDISGPREFEVLASCFNEMAAKLKDKVDNLEQAKREAEALTAKLARSYEDDRATAEKLQETNEWVTDMAFRLEEANQKLKGEMARTETIVHSIRDGIVALDGDEKVILINPEAEEIFDVRAEDVKGSHVQVLADRLLSRIDEPEDFLKKFMASLTNPEVQSEFTVTIVKPFKRVLRRTSSAIHDEGGNAAGRVVTLRDITREKEVEEMKTNFVSTVSHELRTPLTSIKGSLNLLLGGQIEDKDTQREFLRIAEHNADRLISLISNLLDLSRMEEGRVRMKFRKLDLNSVVRSVVKSTSILAKQAWVDIEASCAEGTLAVLGDREKLEQLAANLIGNAIKFSDPGGTVRVKTSVRDDEVVLTVEDEGLGIPKEKLDRVFDRFYQVDMSATRRIGGTGLGLSICRALVKEHAGRIWAESPVTEGGRGARFVVVVPRLQAHPREAQGPSKPALAYSPLPPAEKKEYMVLLVEDDPSMLELHRRSFEHEGYSVVTAVNGRDALKAARENLPGLILLDVVLPDLDGFDVASILRGDELTRDIPIMFTSGLGEEARRRGMDLGNGYITKPFREDQLITEVKKILS